MKEMFIRVEDYFNPEAGYQINELLRNSKYMNKKTILITSYDMSPFKTKYDKQKDLRFEKDLSTPGAPKKVDIPEINLKLDPLPTRGWSSDEKFIQLHNMDKLYFRGERPYEITYLKEAKDNVPSLLDFYSRHGTNDLNKLGLRDLFDTPKPVELIKYLIKIYPENTLTVCDFFAGSGTTAQAVLELNKDYKTNHNFILVQSKEKFDENTTPYKTSLKHGIKPYVSEVLKLRINEVIEINFARY